MSYQLKPDEVLEALQELDPELAAPFEAILCQTVNAMGAHIARLCHVEVGEATMQGVAFAGICLPVSPSYRGQPVPPAIEEYDDLSAWESHAESEDLPEREWRDPVRNLIGQIASCKLTIEAADGESLENDDAMDLFVMQARNIIEAAQ